MQENMRHGLTGKAIKKMDCLFLLISLLVISLQNYNELPTVSFVIPNEANDMHNIDLDGDTAAVKRADHWLRIHLSSYVRWAKKHNSLLIVTFDEDEKGDMHHNHIATIFVGRMVQRRQNNDSISHYNVLRTIEGMYNLPHSGDANANEITNAWK